MFFTPVFQLDEVIVACFNACRPVAIPRSPSIVLDFFFTSVTDSPAYKSVESRAFTLVLLTYHGEDVLCISLMMGFKVMALAHMNVPEPRPSPLDPNRSARE